MLWCFISLASAEKRINVDVGDASKNARLGSDETSPVDDTGNTDVESSDLPQSPTGRPEDVVSNDVLEDTLRPKDVASDDVLEDTLVVYSDKSKKEDDEEPIANTYSLLRFFTGLYYQSTYAEINNYLVDHVETDDVKSNMIEALKWYDAEVSKKSMFNRAIVEALKQFTSLTKIGPDNQCNRNTYAILLKNDRATKRKTHKQPSKLGLMKRIEKVVYEYSMNHAIDCVPRYPTLLKEKLAKLDQDKVQRAENFVDNIIDGFRWSDKKFKNENKRYAIYTLVKSLKSISNKKTSKIALDRLNEYARDDPDRKFLKKVLNEKKGVMEIRKDKVGSLVDQYLIAPCRYYVEQLGLSVFIPANYDLIMLELQDRYKEEDDEALEFLLGWSRYHICSVLIEKDLKSLKKGVAKQAAARTS